MRRCRPRAYRHNDQYSQLRRSGLGRSDHGAGTCPAQRALSRQVAELMRWNDCMDACVQAGAEMVLELGPGADCLQIDRGFQDGGRSAAVGG
jgi:hypothetical protein